MITNIFLDIFATSVSVSLIIIFLFVFTPFLNKRYAAKWKYLMWIIIAVRLVIPFNMDISIPKIVIDVPAQITAPINTDHENDMGVTPSMETKPIGTDNGDAIKILPQTEQTPERLSLLDIIAYLWLTGCLLFLSVHLFSFQHYKGQVAKKGIAVEEDYILQQVCKLSEELRVKPDIRILKYEDAESPMVIGFLKPVLILPGCDYSREELFFVLKHELIHIKRRDIYFKLLFVIANAVHWFNPFIYIMQKEAIVDMELSCDEKVIQQAAYNVRKAYTETLFSAFNKQHKKKTILTTQFYGGKEIMKRRFKNILATSPKKSGLSLCICAFGVILVSGMLIGCSVMGNAISEGQEETDSNAENLSMDDLIKIAEDKSFQSTDFGAYENGERDDLGDDALNYYITFDLTYEGNEYRLDFSFMKDTDILDSAMLIKGTNGEAALLYSSDAEYTVNEDIREFLAYDYDIHDDIRYQLPEGLTETSYSADLGFAGGVLLQPDAYEISGDENDNYCPPEWKAAGIVSRFYTEGIVEWNGEIIEHIYGMENHTSSEEIKYLDGLCAPAFLIKSNHDLYTASELGELEESGVNIDEIDTTSDYWYVYFARPGDELGYVISLNAKNYTMEDMITFAESMEYLRK